MFHFGRKKVEEVECVDNTLAIVFEKGNEVTYKEVEGFFLYEGEYFYKAKGQGGKQVRTMQSFTDFYKEKLNDTSVSLKDISAAVVTQLIVK